VRRQGEAATALWIVPTLVIAESKKATELINHLRILTKVQSAVAASLCRRTQNQALTDLSLRASFFIIDVGRSDRFP